MQAAYRVLHVKRRVNAGRGELDQGKRRIDIVNVVGKHGGVDKGLAA